MGLFTLLHAASLGDIARPPLGKAPAAMTAWALARQTGLKAAKRAQIGLLERQPVQTACRIEGADQ